MTIYRTSLYCVGSSIQHFFRRHHHHLHTHTRTHTTVLFIRIHWCSSEVGACGEDLVSQAAVVPDLVAGEHLEVLLEEPGKPQERLLVRGLVRPLHHTAFVKFEICQCSVLNRLYIKFKMTDETRW